MALLEKKGERAGTVHMQEGNHSNQAPHLSPLECLEIWFLDFNSKWLFHFNSDPGQSLPGLDQDHSFPFHFPQELVPTEDLLVETLSLWCLLFQRLTGCGLQLISSSCWTWGWTQVFRDVLAGPAWSLRRCLLFLTQDCIGRLRKKSNCYILSILQRYSGLSWPSS
jgi:hypothetical protein